MTPRPVGRTAACTSEEARERRSQARAFLDVARLVLNEGPREAHVAAALAVLAGIAAADAICGLRLGRWSRGQDHAQAQQLLRQVSLADAQLPVKLGRLLADKDAAHYSATLMTVERARRLVRRAEALVTEAESS